MMSNAAGFSPADGRPYAKWQEAAVAGWQALPDVLLKNQRKLELSATELLVLINVLSFWWYVDELPFPRVTTLARRMNVTPRTVQRAMQKLQDKGLLSKKQDVDKDGKHRDVLDPSGLVQILRQWAVQDPAFLHRKHRLEHSGLEKDLKDESAIPF